MNEMWSGLGYYSRGRRLWEGAKKVSIFSEGGRYFPAAAGVHFVPCCVSYSLGKVT